MSGGAEDAPFEHLGDVEPSGVCEREERRLGVLGPGEAFERTVQTHVAQRPSQDSIALRPEDVLVAFEQVGAHSHFLAPLAREQHCDTAHGSPPLGSSTGPYAERPDEGFDSHRTRGVTPSTG